ncbi:DUF3103 family protein [Microbispora sp. NEAU-D428]|uniref:DUF3103 family protein n=1 Tax=Microbispora sitophila TaxID=2771537 RepID=UPI001868FF8A|nr:DUF3103 family protein [Microbispora sitophila]MBE3010598.1 DUF3103 family protein [Microbispora sitophila]
MKKVATLAALALAATVAGSLSASPAATAAPTPAQKTADASAANARAATMDGFKRHLAEEVARRLGERQFRDALTRELADDGEADLAALLGSVPGARDLADYARNANSDILKLKGLQAEESLLQIRIDPKQVKRISAGQTLVMATPSGDEKAVRTVVAFDSKGHSQELDAFKAPKRPVLIVGLDEQKSAKLAQRFVRQRLTEAGVAGTDRPAEDDSQQTKALGTTRPVTHILSIVNRNDHEPWYKGGPEIYAWVAGAGTDGKARVDQVEMPYIQQEGVFYQPRQNLIEWSNFSWTSLDVVFMEHDDSADLSALARAVVEGALVISGNSQYVPVADKIIAALPSDWTKDTDDWVELVMEKDAAGGHYRAGVPHADALGLPLGVRVHGLGLGEPSGDGQTPRAPHRVLEARPRQGHPVENPVASGGRLVGSRQVEQLHPAVGEHHLRE